MACNNDTLPLGFKELLTSEPKLSIKLFCYFKLFPMPLQFTKKCSPQKHETFGRSLTNKKFDLETDEFNYVIPAHQTILCLSDVILHVAQIT